MKITAFIPIRYQDCCDDTGAPIFTLQGLPLWTHTIQQVLEVPNINKVVVAYDDSRFLSHLEPWKDQIETYQRPVELSQSGVSVIDVVVHYAKNQKNNLDLNEYIMLFEITHPCRPMELIRILPDQVQKTKSDCLFPAQPIHYNFWRQDPDKGIQRMSGSGEDPNTQIYKELLGIGSLFRVESLVSETPFGQTTDIVPIAGFAPGIDVRNADGLWLAEQYLNRKRDSKS